MERILIVGAMGRIASRVTKLLYNLNGLSLRLSSSRSDAVEELRKEYPLADCVKVDLNDGVSLIEAFRGVDRVVIIPPDFVIDEYELVPKLVDAYEKSESVKQIVRLIAVADDVTLSSLSPQFLATRAGLALHTLAKDLLDNTNLPLTFLNMQSWFASSLAELASEDIKANGKFRLPGKDVARPWLTDEDMARCFVKVLTDEIRTHVGKQYSFMSRSRYTFEDIAALLSDCLKKKIDFENTDEGLKEAGEDDLIEYISNESELVSYERIEFSEDIVRFLEREPTELPQWIEDNKSLFL